MVVGKQQLAMQDSGLQVMGLSVQQSSKPEQMMQQTTSLTNTTTSSAIVQQAMDTSMTAEDHQVLEMTPDQSSKDKYKKRLIVAAQSEATSMMKAPIHNKAQPNSVFLSSQDQALLHHKRHADDGHLHNRRAESMGKQKLQGKFTSKADEHSSLEGFLQVKNLQQQTQENFALRAKSNRHTNSFQSGIRPIKNAPFKPKNNSTTTSQLNDSGHGSGGNAQNSLTTTLNMNVANETSNKFGLNAT